jgi:hypothetical protein
MAFESDVKDYETVRDQLKAILARNPDFVGQLINAIRSYNTVTKSIKGKVYGESKSTGKQIYAGPFSSKTGQAKEYDFDAIEELVPVDEFKGVVEIKYVLQKGAEGKLEGLIAKYPKVAAHVHQVPGVTNSSGPKVIEGVDELEALG